MLPEDRKVSISITLPKTLIASVDEITYTRRSNRSKVISQLLTKALAEEGENNGEN